MIVDCILLEADMAKMPPMLLALHAVTPPQVIEGVALYTINPMHKQCRRLVREDQPNMLKVRVRQGPGGNVVCPGCDWCCRLPEGVEPGTVIWVAVAGAACEPDPQTCLCVRMA